MPPPLPPRVPGPAFSSPPERSSNVLIWIAIVAVMISATGLGGLAWHNYRKSRLPERENVTVAEKHRETRDAFSGNGPPASDVETADITKALDHFNAVIGKQKPGDAADVFDSDRLLDELDQIGALNSIPDHNSPAIRQTFRRSVEQAINKQWGSLVCVSRVIKKIKMSDNRTEAVVYDIDTRSIGGTGEVPVKMRWWLRKSSSGWRVWDIESLEEGMRASTLVNMAITNRGNGTPLLTAMTEFQNVIAAFRVRDLKAATVSLQAMDEMQLPVEMVDAASHAIDQCLRDEDNTLYECYHDPDMGPALKSDAFANWRMTHPSPPDEPVAKTAAKPPAVDP